ncbi:mannosyl-glycoprotein endo-beta-N-acetylglucosamidase [Clostridium sp. P21]|uniref:Mannosyl-glycoprotein endo-beta-N-acetylglucosamidase n=1 Tax=Clostridium muellerianum TaxID=2716538 RepID=A0A7Y0HQI5_9CLOT|nr:glucosaminidase domain-containing protein [Clostridium muellerianum]NMM63843.1 mannosyl-glycoprotein endo-beta-N-acetylglucosamidase [Clostridium muellerianum]
MRKKVSSIFKIIVALIILFGAFKAVKYYINKNDHINAKNININLYIDTVDSVSKDKLQVNWKQVAAIDGVRYKRDFSKGNTENITKLADMFLIKNTSTKSVGKSKYKLLSLDEVLDKLSFEKKEKEKVYRYLKDLDSVALNNKLKEDDSYKKFIDELTPAAVDIYNKYGILPSVTISQAILESGWGKSQLTSKSNNLFGIKADSSWKGKSVVMKTSEYYNKIINDSFRVYASKSESLKDYGDFLYKNKRYKDKGVLSALNYKDQAEAIEKAGYSTIQDEKGNEIYADLVIKIIKQNNLQLIDNKIQLEKSQALSK